MTVSFATPSDRDIPLHAVAPADLESLLDELPPAQSTWARANGYAAKLGQTIAIPGIDGKIACAIVGVGDAKSRRRTRFGTARAASQLPAGTYAISAGASPALRAEIALGWLMESYRFSRYRDQDQPKARLARPDGIDWERIEAIATGEYLTRDLINTPASDMGPDALEGAARDLAEKFSAEISVITGDELLSQNFPLIHTVGRASTRAPRLIDMTWGNSGPSIVLVGKGVCFDTGGLNIKPNSSMGLMKKDMGGAATVLGLAHMIMSLNLNIRLRVLIPAVENSISGNAFRPQDILNSRKGLTVEINNTDAEGRLVLADALALADEAKPDLVISMATLTGAARVAVGGDIAPFFTDEDQIAAKISAAGAAALDPVWRLPLHPAYEAMIEPGIADLDNAPSGGQGGAITAALFLRRFVTASYVHFDIYGWQQAAAPARPKGGIGQGARALLEALPSLLDA
jgi:leucyl aminopeptidase